MKAQRLYLVGLIILILLVSISIAIFFMNYTQQTGLELANLEITNLKNNYTNLQNQYKALQMQFSIIESNYENLKTNYTNLQNIYQNLQSQYESLQNNYSILQTNYTNLQDQYQVLQSQYNTLESNYQNLETNYTNLQNMYQNLQSQYKSLQEQYSNLNNTYWNILTFLGNGNNSAILQPNQFIYKEIAIPTGFSGTINIMISSSNPIEVFVFDLYNLIQAIEGNPYGYYLYNNGTYINTSVTLGPGFYIVFIYNPNNTTEATLSYEITTIYTTAPKLLTNK
ncbi:hypothetical protein Nst1_599 [Candidatus Nanobsidianus stetteri]|uniref:Uncharacterized protein n=1 Tax=Nanobsidianus stetteri TaxID=1294122 RepID=R1E4D2_NANST|nr:hypothetical protein Nst1_599 [Candidatus Nanobsidianus stetteri]